jgi:hypothetical protein
MIALSLPKLLMLQFWHWYLIIFVFLKIGGNNEIGGSPAFFAFGGLGSV